MISHVLQSDSSTSWNVDVPFKEQAQIASIRGMLEAAFLAQGVQLEGPGPRFEAPDGRILSLGNIVQRCCSQPRSRWKEMVQAFASNTMLMFNIEDPMSISAEVVRASLRLRVFEEPTINGWTIDDRTIDDGNVSDPLRDGQPDTFSGGDDSDDQHDDLLADIAKQTLSIPGLPGTQWLLYLVRPGCGQMVLPQHLEHWGIDTEEAFALARINAQFVKPELRARKFGVFLETSDSMFFHTRILSPQLVLPDAPHGWLVSMPTRSDVLVAPASPSTSNFNRMMHLVKATREKWTADPYSGSRHCWFVPPEGLGLYGENAEPIVMTDESPSGSLYPDVHIRFGDRLHSLFGEKTPVRPAPRRVI